MSEPNLICAAGFKVTTLRPPIAKRGCAIWDTPRVVYTDKDNFELAVEEGRIPKGAWEVAFEATP